MKQIEPTVAAMDFREFCIYCKLLTITKKAPTESLFMHFYHHVFSAYLIQKPLKFHHFAYLCRFFFDGHQKYPEELLFQQKRRLKLFEDNDPVVKGFDTLVNELYSEAYLKDLAKTVDIQSIKKFTPFFKGVPGQLE
jgi:hypothetical protein